MLKLLSVFEIETSNFSTTLKNDVEQQILEAGFDVLHDDGGCDIIVTPRFGSNARVEIFGESADVQTRCYITMCGDLCGISRKEAEGQMRDNLDILKHLYKVLGYSWSITEI